MKFASLLALFGYAVADTPASCPYSATLGDWEFSIGTSGTDQSLVAECGLDNLGTVTGTVKLRLQEKNQVTNLDTGSVGTYTIVSTQGFEVSIDGRRFWAYYYFEGNNRDNNDCTRTAVGYVRTDNLKQWSCIQGTNVNPTAVTQAESAGRIELDYEKLSKKYVRDEKFIEKVNAQAKTWTAKHYQEFEKYTLAEMQARQGFELGLKSSIQDDGESLPDQARKIKFLDELPTNWDWRNIDGKRYDSPVWDQSACGSCFAFAAKSVMEGRFRVKSNLNDQPIFSVQEMITCGANENYNQGCSGGFGYLVAGKEMYERGFVTEDCDPEYLSYKIQNTTCPATNQCQRYWNSDYEYVGGYYGAATINNMMLELYNNGPIGVGIYAPSDFHSYTNGIYYSTSVSSDWNPLEPTNHAVVIVGYGRCPEVNDPNDDNCQEGDEDLPYWIVKNSWGAGWGEDGYVRVLLGVDEMAIESKPMSAVPVLNL